MRHPLLASLLALLLVGAGPVAGPAVAADPGPGDEVRVDGAVVGPDGDPARNAVVLVGNDETLTRFSPDELRDLADADPGNLTVVAVGDDGRFDATVPWEHAEAAVALSDDGISDLRWARRENATLSIRLYERRPQTVHAHVGSVPAGERQEELYVSLVNNGDTVMENLSVRVHSVPDGWSVGEVRTDGSYDPDDRTLGWRSVAPGGEVDTTVVLTVPDGEPPGEYTVELRGESDTHLVDVASETETVELSPEDTPGPTTMPPTTMPKRTEAPTTDGGETPTERTSETTTTPTDRPTGTSPPSGAGSGPGLGIVPAVAAVALLAAVLVWRR